jgi:RNA polymerase sigma-70 factor (ECF subfamily)
MDSSNTDHALELARTGDAAALSRLLSAYVPRLERMVALRMSAGERRHFDPSDIVQDALAEAARRFGEWCAHQRLPFHVWLRLVTAECLAKTERRLHQQKRDIARARAFGSEPDAVTTSSAAEWLVSSHTSPTQAARRSELRELVQAALGELDELDREVLMLRQFEQLSNEEAAAELGIAPAAASKRFTRALQRIRHALRALEERPEP